MFTTARAEMWPNAAVFTARAGGKCGLFLHEFEVGKTAKHAKYAKGGKEPKPGSVPVSV